MPQVPLRFSSVGREQMADTLVEALRENGETPSQAMASLLFAQLAAETGGGRSIMNNNPGNLSVFATSYSGDWSRPPWFDKATIAKQPERLQARYHDVHQRMLDNKAPSAFASWPTFQQGVNAYVRRLQSKYPSILAGAKTGSAHAVASAIFDSRYCTDDACRPENNTNNIEGLASDAIEDGFFEGLPVGRGTSRPSFDPEFDFGPRSALPLANIAAVGVAGWLVWNQVKAAKGKKRWRRS